MLVMAGGHWLAARLNSKHFESTLVKRVGVEVEALGELLCALIAFTLNLN